MEVGGVRNVRQNRVSPDTAQLNDDDEDSGSDDE